MPNITIDLADNNITIAGNTYSANGTIKALASGNNVIISSNISGNKLVDADYTVLVDADGNSFGTSAIDCQNTFNAYASGLNPEGFLKTAGTQDTSDAELFTIFMEQ